MSILNKILRLLFPDKCISCDEILGEENEFYLCDECRKRAEFLFEANKCKVCSALILEGEELCLDCKTHKRNFVKNISCAVYSGSIQEAILHFKFHNRPESYRAFAEMILFALRKEDLPEIDVLAAVPVHKNRLKKREYNQSDLIAKFLSDRLKIPYADTELIKIKDAPPQSTVKKAKDRFKNIEGAFKVTEKSAFSGKNVLLIDDIFTTGATISEVTKMLLKSGATKVYTVTIAKTKEEK